MKYLLCVLVALSVSFYVKSQNKMNEIKEIWIYDYFEERGFTTGGAYSHFEDMKETNTSKFKLEKEDMDSLICILSKAKVKKLFPGKTGTFILFAEFVYIDNSVSKVTIQTNSLRNYTLNKDYWIKDFEHQKWIVGFKSKMKNN